MPKKNKIKPEIQKNTIGGKKISDKAFEVPEEKVSTDHLTPVFSFMDTCPNHFQLDNWTKPELKSLIDQLRQYSKMTWAELRTVKGFRHVESSTFSKELPRYLSPDIKVFECRISGKMRLFGHRVKNIFHIIWFDRNHEVYPMS